MGAEIDDATSCCQNWADSGISTTAEADNFTPNSILLCGKGESDSRGSQKLPVRRCFRIEEGVTSVEAHIS